MRRALGIEVPRTVKRTIKRQYKNGTVREMPHEGTVWDRVRLPKGREVTLLDGDDQFRPVNMHTMRRAYASGLALKGWTRAQMRTAGGWTTDAMPARYDLSAQQERVDARGTTPSRHQRTSPKPPRSPPAALEAKVPDPLPRPALYVVVELPTGDWAEVPPGGVICVYWFDDAGMDEVRAGMDPAKAGGNRTDIPLARMLRDAW